MTTQSEKTELLNFLSPLTDLACKMILAGTLKKNVVRHFTNKGLPLATAENLMELGVCKAENLMQHKVK